MRNLLTSIVLSTSIFGCASDTPPITEEFAQALTCPPPTIDPLKSLEVVADTAITSKFSFNKVMTQIATSANATNTPTAIFDGWMNTFNDCTVKGIDPHGFGIKCRPEITDLASLDPFGAQGYVPLAVVNRFDLAPKSGSDCGEYRIVFGLPAGFERVARSLLIFEAREPNPRPDLGLAGCAPLADFWAGLSTVSASSRAQKLANLYFNGLTAGGETFEPVVSASHYGLAVTGSGHVVGQIRTNMLAIGIWQLREFKLGKPCAAGASCDLAVQHVTVKTNPANEVFANTDQLATDFQAKFLKQVPALSSTDLATIGMTTPNTDNEYESVSLGSQDVVYRNFANSTFQAEIQGVVKGGLTVTNVLDRATTQTCAGCHQISNSVNLGPSGPNALIWPNSGGFVHVSEQKQLSPALTNVFLPHRADVLNNFLLDQCNGTQIPDDGTNLGGGALDSPN